MDADQKAYCIVAGKLLAHLRASHHYSQGKLAQEVGMAQSTLSRIERGEIAADTWQMKKLAAVFNMTTVELIDKIEESFIRTKKTASQNLNNDNNWDGVIGAVGVIGLASLAGFVVAALLGVFDDE